MRIQPRGFSRSLPEHLSPVVRIGDRRIPVKMVPNYTYEPSRYKAAPPVRRRYGWRSTGITKVEPPIETSFGQRITGIFAYIRMPPRTITPDTVANYPDILISIG